MSESQYKFAEFELDPSRFELRRNGRVLKLERIPMELLLLLAEKEGSVVTRQVIVDRLWGKEVFVDTEHGINTAIRKIRQALRDDPERPRFVHTVTGKGYRFVADRNATNADSSRAAPATEAVAPAQPPVAPALQPAPKPRTRLAALAALILLVVAGLLIAVNAAGMRDRLFPASRARQIHSIAVLPLANLSGDASQDYFAEGMTDEVITMLAKNTSLRVVSRTSAMQYKGVNRPLPEIARELGVDGILEGSIERLPNRLHMNLQLIYAPTDTHVWAESYDRDLNQAFALPSELSETIAKEVKTATSPKTNTRYINPEAHDAYLHGRYFWFAGNDQRSQEYFEKAIHIQPDYAPAWAGLSISYALRAIDDEAPAKGIMAPTEAAARKAVELDDSLPEAHHALAAWHFFFAWDLLPAEAESRRAIELDPSVAEQHHLHSYILMAMNRKDEALEEQKRATELDPFTRSWGLGFAYLQLRQFDAAISELRMRADAMPNEALIHFSLSNAYWHKGMWKESEAELKTAMELAGHSAEARAEHKAFQEGGEKSVEQLGLKELLARAQNEYSQALRTKDNSYNAQEEAQKYVEHPYQKPKSTN